MGAPHVTSRGRGGWGVGLEGSSHNKPHLMPIKECAKPVRARPPLPHGVGEINTLNGVINPSHRAMETVSCWAVIMKTWVSVEGVCARVCVCVFMVVLVC